jgi:myo-inositol-1(or 4)-monophosphatase
MELGMSMRNFGSGALQLAHVAGGRLDGFIELELSIWDAIGALLIVEEAGGRTALIAPSPITAKAVCIAGTPGIFEHLVDLVERTSGSEQYVAHSDFWGRSNESRG